MAWGYTAWDYSNPIKKRQCKWAREYIDYAFGIKCNSQLRCYKYPGIPINKFETRQPACYECSEYED